MWRGNSDLMPTVPASVAAAGASVGSGSELKETKAISQSLLDRLTFKNKKSKGRNSLMTAEIARRLSHAGSMDSQYQVHALSRNDLEPSPRLPAPGAAGGSDESTVGGDSTALSARIGRSRSLGEKYEALQEVESERDETVRILASFADSRRKQAARGGTGNGTVLTTQRPRSSESGNRPVHAAEYRKGVMSGFAASTGASRRWGGGGFDFLRLPTDVQEYIMRFMRVTEMGRFCEVCIHIKETVFEHAAVGGGGWLGELASIQ